MMMGLMLIFFYGFITASLFQKSLLVILIGLEIMALSVFMALFIFRGGHSIITLFSFMVFAVCEACLGLTLLLLRGVNQGSDLVNTSAL